MPLRIFFKNIWVTKMLRSMREQTSHRAWLRVCVIAVAVMIVGWVGLAPEIAAAQSPEELERFEAKVSQGQAYFDDGEFDEAIDILLKAEEIFEHPTLSLRITEASAEAGHCGEADQRLAQLREGSPPDDVESRLDSLTEVVSGCVSTGTVVVDCTPSQAEVDLEEKTQACGEAFEMESGNHQGQVNREGYRPSTISFTVTEGQETTISVTLDASDDAVGSGFPMRGVGVGSMAAGVGLAGVGLWIDSSAGDRQRRIEQAVIDGDHTMVEELQSDAETRRRQTIAFVGLGGVVASAGVVMYVLGGRADEPAEGGSLVLLPGVQSLGIGLLW